MEWVDNLARRCIAVANNPDFMKFICSIRRSPTNCLWPCQERSLRWKASRVPPTGATSASPIFVDYQQ